MTVEGRLGMPLWSSYLAYLHEWAWSHEGKENEGMSPACWDEWCGNEQEEAEDGTYKN